MKMPCIRRTAKGGGHEHKKSLRAAKLVEIYEDMCYISDLYAEKTHPEEQEHMPHCEDSAWR